MLVMSAMAVMIVMVLGGCSENPEPKPMRMKVPLAVRGERCLEGQLYLFSELPFVLHARLLYYDGYVVLVFHPDCDDLTFLLWLRFLVLKRL